MSYNGYSPTLPMDISHAHGHYALNTTIKSVVLQNLRVLFLTSPKERLMHPNFGIGLYQYLFEQNTVETQIKLDTRIRAQVRRYMPQVAIINIEYLSPLNANDMANNHFHIKFEFVIKATGERATLEL